MRKTNNKESIDGISQGLLIKQRKTRKEMKQKNANCSSRNRTKKEIKEKQRN